MAGIPLAGRSARCYDKNTEKSFKSDTVDQVSEETAMVRRPSLGSVFFVFACGFSTVLWSGCASPQSSSPKPEPKVVEDSLYQRIGGHAVLESIASGWVDQVVVDPALKARFAATNADQFKARLTALLCEISGGPEVYTGKDMKTAHRGMNVSDAEWKSFIENLRSVLDTMKIPPAYEEELLVKVEPMKGIIVGQ
jgi:hemoglobin